MLIPVGHSNFRFSRTRDHARFHWERTQRAAAHALEVAAEKTRQAVETATKADAIVRKPLYYGANAAYVAGGLGLIPAEAGQAAWDVARSYEGIRHALTREKSWL